MNTVVVSGVSKGFGLVLANKLSSENWQVIGTGRSDRPNDLSVSVEYQQFDASDPKKCEDFWEKMSKQNDTSGSSTCLVNNAGGYVGGGLLEANIKDFENQLHSIYLTAVYMTRYLAQFFNKAKIVNVISSGALTPLAKNSAYGAAKAAEMHFFQSIQKEFKPSQYTISNLYPDNIASNTPASSAIDPIDLADFISKLLISESSYYVKDVSISSII